MFNHLQVHTHYSLLEAIWAPKAYIEQAKNLWMQALACTDYGGMYGAVEFYQAAKKAGIKPIIWTELWYVADMLHKDPQESAWTILLLARTYAWYEQLMKLVSAAHLTWFHKIPRIDHSCLAEHATDLIAIVGGDRSRLGKSLLQKHDDALILDQRQQLTSTLWSDYCFLSRIAQEKPTWNLHTCNELVHRFGSMQNCKIIGSGDVHYVHAHDQQIFETALAIKDGKRIYDTERRLATHQMHLQSEDEITQWLTKTELNDIQITELIDTTQLIADSIDLQIPMDTILFPIYESPEHISASYAAWKNDLIEK